MGLEDVTEYEITSEGKRITGSTRFSSTATTSRCSCLAATRTTLRSRCYVRTHCARRWTLVFRDSRTELCQSAAGSAGGRPHFRLILRSGRAAAFSEIEISEL